MALTRRLGAGLVALAVLAGAAYLYDPPWVAGITSGIREWEEDPPGTRFRWTAGHASFFVPGEATTMTLPLRAVFPLTDGKPVVVSVAVDDRWLADVELKRPDQWEDAAVPLPRARGLRRHRRVDLRVSRVVGFYNLGVQLGEPHVR